MSRDATPLAPGKKPGSSFDNLTMRVICSIITGLMKILGYLSTLILAATLVFTGCGGGKKVDTAKLEGSFASATAELKDDVKKIADAIKNQDFSTAVAQLQKLNVRANLTAEQKDAIKELIEKLQTLIAEGANKSVEKAAGQTTKALDDLKKAGSK